MSSGHRDTYARTLLGEDTYRRVRESKILVVGAGGIGCELLKNLVLVGFGNIEIIDLDTIDLSNLNRQFLFRKADIKKSKALVASAFAKHFNPGPGPQGKGDVDAKGVAIRARHGNIKESENDVEWMKGFDLVLSALDNLDARRHVNRLCCAAGVPLIESGTQGYLGQVTPMQKGRTECFDCVAKPVPKTFPVCTIRATPSEPIHCIVWGKSYLFGKLFGEDDEAGDETELEKAKADGENAEEIDNLKKEAAAFQEVRKQMSEADGARRVFEKVFSEDIQRLLSMEDMWKVEGRVKPVPLEYESIMSGTFVTPPVRKAAPANGKVGAAPANGKIESAPENGKNGVEKAPAEVAKTGGLKDQRELSVKDNLELFIDSCNRLSARAISHPEIPLAFDKDDDDTLDFVLATANLRAIAYGIPTKTRFEVKQMAGNIIPAIATTNAIIAGFIVMRAINILENDWQKATNVFLKADPARPLGTFATQPPEPNCGVCQDVYIPLACDPSKLTLGVFVNEIVRGWLGWKTNDEGEELEFSVYEGNRELSSPDDDDNHGKTLAEMNVSRGMMLTVVDEDNVFANVAFPLSGLQSDKLYELPQTVPEVPKKPVKEKALPPSPPPQIVGQKRPAPEDEPTSEAKRAKTSDVPSGNDKASAQMVYDSDDDIEIL